MRSANGASARSTGSTACSPSRSGARASRRSTWRAIRKGSSRSTGVSKTKPRPSPRRSAAWSAGAESVPRLDRRALGQFLEFGYTFEEERTCLEGVRKLPPGHYLRLTAQAPDARPTRYWRPDLTPRPDAEADLAVEELHETLRLVVQQHLVADAPIGMLLSGGIDSSLLAALAARETHLRTLTMGFAQSSLDERPQARRVAQALNCEHEELMISPEDVERAASESAKHFDDLFADWGLVSTQVALRQGARARTESRHRRRGRGRIVRRL